MLHLGFREMDSPNEDDVMRHDLSMQSGRRLMSWRPAPTQKPPRLGEILVQRGRISRDQLDQAIQEQQLSGRRLGELLIARGWVTRTEVSGALRTQRKYLASLAVILFQVSSAAFAGSTGQEKGEEHVSRAAAHLASHHSNERLGFLARYAGETPQQQRRRKRARTAVPGGNAGGPAESGRKPRSGALPLPPEVAQLKVSPKLKQRIARYLPAIRRAAVRFDVPLSLILSVMHTESHFDHDAESGMDAHGLMQVVPRFAGREAYRLVFDRAGTPSAEELRDPDTNILLGTAYLRRLERGYFGDIRDPQLRRAAVIAAYNVGPSKLKRIFEFHGEPASIDSLKSLLARHTPRETQAYLVKVSRRQQLYRHLPAMRTVVASLERSDRSPAAG